MIQVILDMMYNKKHSEHTTNGCVQYKDNNITRIGVTGPDASGIDFINSPVLRDYTVGDCIDITTSAFRDSAGVHLLFSHNGNQLITAK